MKGDTFGNHLKEYERIETGRRFMPFLPIVARIDGRCFSRFTKGMQRPFDHEMSRAMISVAKYLVEQTHACIGYTQSDEISLTWLAERYASGIFFDGKVQKMCSILAGITSAFFARYVDQHEYLRPFGEKQLPHFDCRVFQLPTLDEGANVFLWRELDATKNAISMAASVFYSHNDLHGKSSPEMQEMLFQKGINFTEYPVFFKRGTFVRRVTELRTLSDAEWFRIPILHRPERDLQFERSSVREIPMPIFSKVINRREVIYQSAAPVTDCMSVSQGLGHEAELFFMTHEQSECALTKLSLGRR